MCNTFIELKMFGWLGVQDMYKELEIGEYK